MLYTTDQLREMAGTDRFRPFAGNPVISCGEAGAWDAGALGSMTVVKVDGMYHMYYEAWQVRSRDNWDASEYCTLSIGHATSVDGIHWNKDPASPVIARSDDKSEWDHNGTWDPFVLYEDGIFKMWYGAGQADCDWAYAYSEDGVNFTKVRRISNLGNVEDIHVVHQGGLYHAFYWDRKHEPMALFRAMSPNETDFDFENAQIIEIAGEDYPGMYKFSHVIVEDGTWYMFYGNFVRPHCANGTVRMATSEDGLSWTKVHGDLLAGNDGEILKVDEELYLMYYGPRDFFDAKDCDIRVAVYSGSLPALVE